MLQLKNITKNYAAGEINQAALNGVSISFRENEFVSILGQSGSGKTTMLNIIGGLDHYTSGDLVINGRSTKEYRDGDWDTYRNHSIGFIFQSYNLIPHQSVLSNVELALTLSGVSKTERRKKAKEVLKKVGLNDQMHKRPNQMSGGQMQRVAIARALVNNPDILLADEPTGALDSETSVQIMELLKEIAKDKLVIMVTHNPEIAEKYSTRIVRLLDGKVTDDSDPFECEATEVISKKEQKKLKSEKKKRSMSFFTAMSLSLNNLMTKKGRTLLTSFAGSIGIIGIALILSVSTGVQAYIDQVQEDTLASYPITLQEESVDLTALITSMSGAAAESEEAAAHELDAVYESSVMYDMMNALNSTETNTNNLKKFREFLENNEEINEYISAVQYSYGIDFNVYTKDTDGKIVKSDVMELFRSMGGNTELVNSSSSAMMTSSYQVWQEMLPGSGEETINPLLTDQYEVVAGEWPDEYDEIVIIVDKNNEISDVVLYALGLKTDEEMKDIMTKAALGEQIDTGNKKSWSYDEILGMNFKLVLNTEYFQKNADGTYTDLSETDTGLEYLYNNDSTGINLRVSGIVRSNGDAVSAMMSGSIGYTSKLTDYVIEKTSDSEIIKQQLNNPGTDVISGLPFETDDSEPTADEIKNKVKDYFASLTSQEKAGIYVEIASVPTDEYLETTAAQYVATLDRDSMKAMMISAYAEQMGVTDTSSIEEYIDSMDDETLYAYVTDAMKERITVEFSEQTAADLSAMSAGSLAALLETTEFTDEQYMQFYSQYVPSGVSGSTYDENITRLGYIDASSPTTISIYASTFANKDEISRVIQDYNSTVSDEDKIEYTDYIKLLMSSITTIIDAISYVLIAFVAISLVVSSIMIGIITYISVLERTKEIGILRAIGASKKDVSRVFNAETLIVGLAAGGIGIGITLLLLIPINLILHSLTGIEILSAQLPVFGAVALVIISMLLTFIAGLIPSGFAAKKDPVEALRTE